MHTLDASPPPQDLEDSSELEAVGELYTNTLFHGTGRKAKGYEERDKSRPTGEIVDVLEKILSEGLQPQVDIVARLLLPVERTISLTRQRIYARYYAEEFGTDEKGESNIEYIFGDRKYWENHFWGETRRLGKTIKNWPWLFRILANLATRFSWEEICEAFNHKKNYENQMERWLANKAAIQGNHPMIFGIDEDQVNTINLPHGANLFEVRTAEIIPPGKIKFIEVPQKYIEEIRTAIAKIGWNIHVIPMELGEAFCWKEGVEECGKPIL